MGGEGNPPPPIPLKLPRNSFPIPFSSPLLPPFLHTIGPPFFQLTLDNWKRRRRRTVPIPGGPSSLPLLNGLHGYRSPMPVSISLSKL